VKLKPEQVQDVDLPEMPETFADSLGMSSFDGGKQIVSKDPWHEDELPPLGLLIIAFMVVYVMPVLVVGGLVALAFWIVSG
jgi:hypothetical protein